MARQLTIPQGGYLRRQTPSLGGIQVQIVTRWAEGPGAWYVDVSTASGERILSGQRVSPGGYVWTESQDPRLPAGSLYASGPDPYRRDQMGLDVQLVYYEPGEAP